ncbi:hypothetical protein COB11_05345 [Candidatus Aerophobetes bacterium]|uniref:Uncharacterized protein n=1 Tax=Aerophobetes bacterium TaxID=2030807 RepID=A0A2A4YEY8_UNCAE|nr:MAG: hypothetical protein COB11_08080 [Candidatus Aerophobetes bacterium]PCI93418.1 MAG: hypothetical protein COB11_05345 [Candidatus Aerophobetes bacterium]
MAVTLRSLLEQRNFKQLRDHCTSNIRIKYTCKDTGTNTILYSKNLNGFANLITTMRVVFFARKYSKIITCSFYRDQQGAAHTCVITAGIATKYKGPKQTIFTYYSTIDFYKNGPGGNFSFVKVQEFRTKKVIHIV